MGSGPSCSKKLISLIKKASSSAQHSNNVDIMTRSAIVVTATGRWLSRLVDQNPEDVARNLAYFQMVIEAQQQSMPLNKGLMFMLNRHHCQTESELQAQSEAVEAARDTGYTVARASDANAINQAWIAINNGSPPDPRQERLDGSSLNWRRSPRPLHMPPAADLQPFAETKAR